MKTKMNATKMVAIALLAICTIGTSTTALAEKTPNEPIELKYMGKTENQPVFQLNLNSTKDSEYYISIKDESGKVLYSEKVKGENVTRNYRFDVNEFDLSSPDFGITVEVTTAKTHKTQVFHVKSTTHVVENFEVAKL
ncbi:MAG: hypothetical protein KGM16_15900 [Bacteroidota bacterium]|nr:hypothetical protein [Bacteroidota bacterium]